MRFLFAIATLLGLGSTVHAAEPVVVDAHARFVASVAISADGKLVATAGDEPAVKLWNALTGESLGTLRPRSAGTAVALRRDGASLAYGTWDGALATHDPTRGERGFTLAAHAENVSAIAFSPDGSRLATASGDDRLKIWNARTGELVHTLEQGNEYDVTCAAFSPDGRWIASGDGEGVVRVWNAATGESIFALVGHEETVSGVGWIDGGRQIVSGGWDDAVRVWDAATGDEIEALKVHTDDVVALTASSDGKRFAAGSADRSLRVWEAATRRVVHAFENEPDAVNALALSADGRRVAYAVGGRLKIVEAP